MTSNRKKNVKQLTLISVLSVLVFGTFVGITRSNMNKLEVPKISKALTMQTHRRVYAYLEGDWTLDQMYIYYWGGSSVGAPTFENPRLMTQVLDNYYEGLFYYDVPVDHTHCLFRKSSGAQDGNHNQSQDALIAHTYVGNNYKAIKVGPWTADGTKRTITYVDTVPINGNELAQVLSHIQSCSSSYASGYNAWPQLNDLFVTPSTFTGNETVNDNVPPTTINNKVAMLEQEYQKEHGTGPFACYYSGYSNSTLATYVKMSPNKTSPRPNTLTRITPIVTGETFTAYALGETFYSGGGSGNYGIGTDGTIGLYVNEQDRAWSTGGGGINDNRAVTVFCSSDTNAEIYADTYNSMVELAADILVRYCKDTLIWFGDKDATLAYEATIADNEMLLTYSEWFRN